MIQYQTLVWYNTKPWYGTIPNLISPHLLYYTTPYRASPCTLSKVKSVAQQSDEETRLAWPSIITSLWLNIRQTTLWKQQPSNAETLQWTGSSLINHWFQICLLEVHRYWNLSFQFSQYPCARVFLLSKTSDGPRIATVWLTQQYDRERQQIKNQNLTKIKLSRYYDDQHWLQPSVFQRRQQWEHRTNIFLIEASFCRYIAHESHIVSVYDYIHEL